MLEDTQETLAWKLARWREARHVILSRFNHDVRTPLTAIVGFAELLDDGELTPGQRVYVQHILEAADKIVHILNEVQKILNEVEQDT